MQRHRTTIAVLLAASLALAGTVLPATAADPHPAPVAPAADPVVLPVDPAEPVEIGLVLRGRDPEGLTAFLAAVADPDAPEYRAYLTPETYAERFGLPADAHAALIAELAAAGLEVVRSVPQRTSLSVRGSAAHVSAFLGTPLEALTDPLTGLRHLAAPTEVAVPVAIADRVLTITGLERRLPRAAIDPDDAPPLPGRGLKPVDLARAYGFAELRAAGIDGTGSTVAILQYGVDTDEDLAVFDATFGIEAPPPERIGIAGGLADAPDDFAGEATLDTQVVRAAAPGARIIVYGFPSTFSMALAVDEIVSRGEAEIISISYGKCFLPGEYISDAEVAAGQALFATAAALGVNVFVASGDTGAYTCHMFDPEDHRPTPAWPSCADNVISVGGTFLETREDGTRFRETGWQDYLVTAGGGGGVNPVDPRPAWQRAPGVENERSTGMRQCPDVAAAADPDTGYHVFFTDPETGEAGWQMIGGTSAAAPLWAAMAALISQVAREEGRGLGGVPGRLGFLPPELYRIARETPEAFYDVTRGGNLLDAAGEGWDYATGLGTPNLATLAAAIVAALPEAP